MFDPTLEFRKFLQSERTAEEKERKLNSLAERWLARKDCILSPGTPVGEAAESIRESYDTGADLLDPEMFYKEDIIEFARTNRIEGDPEVQRRISLARTAAEWAYV